MTTYAVIAGAPTAPTIGGYTFPALEGVAADVEMAAELWKADVRQVLPRVKADELDAALSGYRGRAVAGDTFVFYFSGHGYREAPGDTDEPDRRRDVLCCVDEPYPDVHLSSLLHGFAPGVHVYAVVDACHAAGLTVSWMAPPPPLPWRRREHPEAKGTVFTIAGSHESAKATQEEADGRVMGSLSMAISRVATEGRDLDWQTLWRDVSVEAQTFVKKANLPTAHLSGPPGMDEGLLTRPAFGGP